MGDALRRRALLWLGIGRVWVELEALSTRLKRLESDTYGARTPSAPPAPPWVESSAQTGIVRKVDDRDVSTAVGVPKSRNRQKGSP